MSRSRRLVILVGLLAIALVGMVRVAHPQQGMSAGAAAPAFSMPDMGGSDLVAPPSLTDISESMPVGASPPVSAPAPAKSMPVAVPAPVDLQLNPTPDTTVRATGSPSIPPADSAPLRDENVIRAQQPLGGLSSMGTPVTPFALDAAGLPLGARAVGLNVQVVAPPTMTLHKPATVTILVKNSGPTDAYGVVVRDELPPGVKFVKAQPEPNAPPPTESLGGLVVWSLGTLPAGMEKQLKVTIEPVQKGPMDHAATVTLASGSRAKTVVLEPVLRVEQMVSRTNVLKGQQIQFDITITNDGDGPARDVIVRADLSPGLKHETEGNVLELDLGREFNKPVLQPRESLKLPTLVVDAVGEGQHTCTVRATSVDVVADAPQAQSVKQIDIVAPVLKLTLEGSQKRYTDTVGEYTLTVENTGTAPAQDVRVSATLVGDGRPYVSKGASWDAANRRYIWTVPTLEPGKPQAYTFRIRYGGLGVFQVNGEAIARGGLKEVRSCSTSVEGTALVDLSVLEDLRVLDVGQETIFKIRLRNMGTKEAHQIHVHAELSPNMEATLTAGTDKEAGADPQTRTKIDFPVLERLAPGTELVLAIKARAKGSGLASCRVFMSHEDLKDGRVEGVTSLTVTDDGIVTK